MDPFGLWTFQIGIATTGGLGGGLTGGGGIVIGYGKEKGFQFGTYGFGGGGIYVGGGGSIATDFTWSKNPNIENLGGLATTVGGSAQAAASPSIGGEVNYPWDKTAKASYTFSIGGGVGTPEGHSFLTEAKIKTIWTSRKKCPK